MPPRYSYWTIIVDAAPTAFRAAKREELLPTFERLRRTHPSAELRWFSRGRLWDSPEAQRASSAPADERRGPDWRPGGKHQDPRDRFKKERERRRERRMQERDGSGSSGPGHGRTGEAPPPDRRGPAWRRDRRPPAPRPPGGSGRHRTLDRGARRPQDRHDEPRAARPTGTAGPPGARRPGGQSARPGGRPRPADERPRGDGRATPQERSPARAPGLDGRRGQDRSDRPRSGESGPSMRPDTRGGRPPRSDRRDERPRDLDERRWRDKSAAGRGRRSDDERAHGGPPRERSFGTRPPLRPERPRRENSRRSREAIVSPPSREEEPGVPNPPPPAPPPGPDRPPRPGQEPRPEPVRTDEVVVPGRTPERGEVIAKGPGGSRLRRRGSES